MTEMSNEKSNEVYSKVMKCTLKWEHNGSYTTSNLIITRKTNTVTIKLRLPTELCVM